MPDEAHKEEVLDTQAFTKERWDEMIQLLDKDNSGSVDKEEYRTVWMTMFAGKTDEDFEKQWEKIDEDGNGELSVQELANYYGFNLETGTAAEMTDDQILEALRMQATLIELDREKDAKLKAEAQKKAEEDEKKKQELGVATLTRDTTIKQVDMARKKKPDDESEKLITFLEACTLGELKSDDPDKKTVATFLGQSINCRIECEQCQMPLHKLAKVKVTDRNKSTINETFDTIVKLTREQAKAAGKTGIQLDMNHQDSQGRTPLYSAVEGKNKDFMKWLFGLKSDGPDTLLVNTFGWTVMHSAVNTDDLEILKELVSYCTPQRLRLLLKTPDKTGREPLHIAAYKCSEEMVTYLMKLGSTDTRSDTAGNTPSVLAGRAGRKKSKELIEEIAKAAPAAA